ncbi:MAG: prepilin-type N-terminal cleavage/methylation domain-containing protein [Aquificaceae bacterium]|nr:prepilin-type N-terminal cleavage/methylation domain-containing protein [Aquificaceae bacterium]
MRKERGFTLVELLIVMVLSLILAGGLIALYRSLIGNVAERSTVVKNQAQLNFVMDNLAKLLSSAGFGIDNSKLNYGSGNVINLINNNQRLEILTRVASQNTMAGCWGYIDSNGNFKLSEGSDDIMPVSFTTLRNCPTDPGSYPIRISMIDKSLNCQSNCLAFRNDPVNLRLYLDSQNLSPQCLNGTQRLMLDMNGTPAEIIQCVAHLRFRYLCVDQNNEIEAFDTPCPYDQLRSIRLCMMVQLSESAPATGTNTEPEYTDACGGGRLTQLNPNIQNTWRNRKWGKVEMDIFMPNLH